MRDAARIPRILGAIEAIWTQCPDYRLGQLLANHAFPVQADDIFYVEDDVVESSLAAAASKYAPPERGHI